MDTLGEFLQREREIRQISLDEVAEGTKISRRHLEAIEEDRYSSLPGEAFVRGFIRSYVKYIGLDPEETMLMYHQGQPAQEVSSPQRGWTTSKRRSPLARPVVWCLLAGIVVVGVILFSAVTFLEVPGQFGPGFPSRADVAARPHVPPPLILTAIADSDTWLLVTIDGTDQQDVLLRAGQSLKWTGKERFILSIGNVRGTRLKLNGRELGIPVSARNILRHYTLSRDMLQ